MYACSEIVQLVNEEYNEERNHTYLDLFTINHESNQNHTQWDLKSGIHQTKGDNLLDANGKTNELEITT